jgi:hypothetical protein
MSETPKFEVIDRRKMKAEEEQMGEQPSKPAAQPSPEKEKAAGDQGGPRLVVNESRRDAEAAKAEPEAAPEEAEMPPAPTAEESRQQKVAYDASSQRLEDLIRAQNPAAGPLPPVNFEQLVQQFYVSAMIQMGAGTQEGQRARVDIVGARNTIDLLGVLAEKTKGNLNEVEQRTLDSVLFEARMAFLELTNMIHMQAMQPPVPPPGKK